MRFLELHRQLNEATKEYNYVKIISDKIGKFLDYFQKNVDKFGKNKISEGSYSFDISEIVKEITTDENSIFQMFRKGTVNFVRWKKNQSNEPEITLANDERTITIRGGYLPKIDEIIVPYIDFTKEKISQDHPSVDKIKSTILHELTHKLQTILKQYLTDTVKLSRDDWFKNKEEQEAILNQMYNEIQKSLKNKLKYLFIYRKEYFEIGKKRYQHDYIDANNELYRIFKSEEDFEKEFYRDVFGNKNILSRAEELNKIDKNIMKDFLSDSYYELQKEFENVYPEKKIEKKDGKYSLTESFENDYKKFIAYHQTSKENAKQIKRSGFNFKNAAQKILWFTNNLKGLKDESLGSANTGAILKLEVTINKAADWDLYDDKNLDELEKLGYDGVILKEKNGDFDGFVFSPKQLKVLDVIDSVENIKENEERSHGKLMSELKPSLKTVMIFRARDNKSDTFESKDYVTLSSKFALEHAESNHVYSEEPHIVVRATVPTKHLAEASNPGEWFYIGPTVHGDVVYKSLGPDEYEGKIIDLKFARKLKL